ncbi:MAG: ion channel-forming bestrophin family protein [Burkholderiales bacterium]|jgi:putative membrane protein
MIVRDRPSGLRLFLIMRGSVLSTIWKVLLVNVAIAILVTVAHGAVFDFKITLTAIPFSLIGLALAIFLGFRNNAAYDRYWEGRKLWGQLVAESRNLARQCRSLIAFPEPLLAGSGPADLRTRMIYRTIAFAHSLRHQLRGTDDSGELKGLLADEEWRRLARTTNHPHYLMLRMGDDLRLCLQEGRVDGCLGAAIDDTFASMVTVATGCERLKNTPIPFSYTLLLHRTAYLYCFLLPFGLVDSIGFMTPVVVAIVAYTFFGLDALGDEIEEPFGLSPNDLPLDAICRMIEIDLRTSVGDANIPPPLAPVDYWLR